MDIIIPDPHDPAREAVRPRDLYKLTKQLSFTSREIKLTKNYTMCLTPENIPALNHLQANSGNGAVYFCIVEVGQFWTFSPPKLEACDSVKDYEDILEFFELVDAAHPQAIRELAKLYVDVAGKLIMVEETVDGKTIGLLKYVKTPLDNLRGEKNE